MSRRGYGLGECGLYKVDIVCLYIAWERGILYFSNRRKRIGTVRECTISIYRLINLLMMIKKSL